MPHICKWCGKPIAQRNPGNLCFSCQEKRLEEQFAADEDLVDAEGYAAILGLDSAESLKRLARKDRLAPRIPGIRKWLWRKDAIDAWLKPEQRTGDVSRKTAMGIASNLRRCSKDPIICALSDTIGSNVYGQEHVMGIGYAGQAEPINLVKVDKSVALQIIEELPEKDFPELSGITDWADLPYDRIEEDLIIRLEAYF